MSKYSKVTVIIETDDEQVVYIAPKVENFSVEQDLTGNPDHVFVDPRTLQDRLSFSFNPIKSGEDGITFYTVDSRSVIDPVLKFAQQELKMSVIALHEYLITLFKRSNRD